MKIYFTLPFILLALSVYAQPEGVIKAMEQYGISSEHLENSFKDNDAQYFFKYESTSVSSEGTEVTLAEFDPRREVGARWELISIDGKNPSKKQLKSFNKAHNTTAKDVNGSIDENSFAIIEDNEESLKIKFRYLESSMPKKYHYIADCDGYLTIDKAKGELTEIEFVTFRPTSFSVLKIPSLEMDIEFIYFPDSPGFHISKEVLDINARLLGQDVKMLITNVYSEYTLVK